MFVIDRIQSFLTEDKKHGIQIRGREIIFRVFWHRKK